MENPETVYFLAIRRYAVLEKLLLAFFPYLHLFFGKESAVPILKKGAVKK